MAELACLARVRSHSTIIRVFYKDAFLCRAICPELAGQKISLKEITQARNERRKLVRQGIDERLAVVEQFIAVHQPEPPLPPADPVAPPTPRLKRYFSEESTPDKSEVDSLLSKLVEMRRQRKLSSQMHFSWTYIERLLAQLNQGKQQSSDQSRRGVSHAETEQGVIQLLSKREMDILHSIGRGLSNQAIADEMMIELSTVKSHLKHIYRKLNVESRTQAVVLARKLDLL